MDQHGEKSYPEVDRRADTHQTLKSLIKTAVEEVLMEEKIWRHWSELFIKNMLNALMQWIGKRVFTAAVTAGFGALILYLVKEGYIK